MEATICSGVSIPSGRSTEIRMSSAGDRLTLPPQTTQPPQRSTTARIAASSRSTRAKTSMVSAVPAGEVIARDEVFGISRPWAATIGVMIRLVRLPGMPPMQCLSTIVRSPHETGAGRDHGLGERKRLVRGHETRAGDQEGRDLHIRQAVGDQVRDHVGHPRGVQLLAADLGPHGVEAHRRRGRRDLDPVARRDAEPPKRRLRQPDLVCRQPGAGVGDHRRGQDHDVRRANLQTADAGEALGAQHAVVAGQNRDVLPEGVEWQQPRPKAGFVCGRHYGRSVVFGVGHSRIKRPKASNANTAAAQEKENACRANADQ